MKGKNNAGIFLCNFTLHHIEETDCFANEKEKDYCICGPKYIKDQDGICRGEYLF